MTNLKKYGSATAALAIYNNGPKDVAFATWCDKEIESDYPSWVKPGARYYHTSVSELNPEIYTVQSVLDDRVVTTQKGWGGENVYTPKHCFVGPLPSIVEYTLPAWVKLGCKFKYPYCSTVYTVVGINLNMQKVKTNPGSASPFSHFKTKGLIEVTEPVLPSWVKVGQWIKSNNSGNAYRIKRIDLEARKVHYEGCRTFDWLEDVLTCHTPITIKPWTIDQAAEARRIGTRIILDDNIAETINAIVSFQHSWYLTLGQVPASAHSWEQITADELAKSGITDDNKPCGTY
jgi:hypothetical protein